MMVANPRVDRRSLEANQGPNRMVLLWTAQTCSKMHDAKDTFIGVREKNHSRLNKQGASFCLAQLESNK